jgi:hypothetical protein
VTRRLRPYLTSPVPPGLAARRQETARAKAVGGRRQPGSGNRPGFRGDVRTENAVEELKFTTKQSYSLKLEDLQKIEEYALSVGSFPLFTVEFRRAVSVRGVRWTCMPEWVLRELME